jgi:DNA-binding transcriptional LysR family regulator
MSVGYRRPGPGLERLRLFATIAEHEHVSRAAAELGMSQPALSAQLRVLEREVGVALVQPSGRGVRLTDAGRVVHRYARRVNAAVASLEEEVAALRGLARGHLRLGASQTIASYLLAGWLAELRRSHPGVGIAVRVTNTDSLIDLVGNQEIDLAVVAATITNPDLRSEKLGEDRLVLIAPPGPRPIELRGSTLILRERGSATRRMVERALEDAGIRPAATIELGSTEGIKQAVAGGLGVAFVSIHAVSHDLAGPRLRVANHIPMLDLRRPLHLITRHGHSASPAERAFISAVHRHAGVG